jgi:hypothetical protein
MLSSIQKSQALIVRSQEPSIHNLAGGLIPRGCQWILCIELKRVCLDYKHTMEAISSPDSFEDIEDQVSELICGSEQRSTLFPIRKTLKQHLWGFVCALEERFIGGKKLRNFRVA